MGGMLPKAEGTTAGGGDGGWGGKMGGGARRKGGEVEAGEKVVEGSLRKGASLEEKGVEAEGARHGRTQLRRGWDSEPVNPSPPPESWERDGDGERGKGRREGWRGPVGSRLVRYPRGSSTASRTPRSQDHHQDQGHAGGPREPVNSRGGWEDSEPARELVDGDAEYSSCGEGRQQQQQRQQRQRQQQQQQQQQQTASSNRGWTSNTQFQSRPAKGDLRRDSDPIWGASAMQLDLMLARPPSRPWATAR